MRTEETQRLRRRSRGSAPWERVAGGGPDGWGYGLPREETGDCSVEIVFILHGGAEKFFGLMISFFRSFISVLRSFI